VEDLLGADFRLGECSPQFGGHFDVIFGCLVLVVEDHRVFEGNSEMFLKIVEGGSVGMHGGVGLLFMVRAFIVFGVVRFLGLFMDDRRGLVGEHERFLFEGRTGLLFSEKLFNIGGGVSSFEVGEPLEGLAVLGPFLTD
jgi:hypothetical protein